MSACFRHRKIERERERKIEREKERDIVSEFFIHSERKKEEQRDNFR